MGRVPARRRRLRPHHLFCQVFQTYSFEERTETFRKELEGLKDAVRAGHDVEVELTEGVDELCHLCEFKGKAGCAHPDGGEEDVKKWDSILLKELNLNYGTIVTAREAKALINRNYPLVVCRRCPHQRKGGCAIEVPL